MTLRIFGSGFLLHPGKITISRITGNKCDFFMITDFLLKIRYAEIKTINDPRYEM
jgi:hypothetical protein